MVITDAIVRDYLRFMIAKKEITGRGYRNRKAPDFYRHLRQNANRYGISVLDALKRDAYFVMCGEILKSN